MKREISCNFEEIYEINRNPNLNFGFSLNQAYLITTGRTELYQINENIVFNFFN